MGMSEKEKLDWMNSVGQLGSSYKVVHEGNLGIAVGDTKKHSRLGPGFIEFLDDVYTRSPDELLYDNLKEIGDIPQDVLELEELYPDNKRLVIDYWLVNTKTESWVKKMYHKIF
jgi:hypothetical protein